MGWRVRKDGTRFWADVVITALHDEAGALTGYAKVTRDLTEQHELETGLRESEERLRLLSARSWTTRSSAFDPQGVIRTWNLGAEQVKGYSAEEAIGRSFAMFYTEDRPGRRPPGVAADRRRGRPGRVEHSGWRVRKDGTRFWGDVVITALHPPLPPSPHLPPTQTALPPLRLPTTRSPHPPPWNLAPEAPPHPPPEAPPLPPPPPPCTTTSAG